MLLASVFLLNAFINVRVKEKFQPIILFLSSASFGVYLIHCQPAVYRYILNDAFVPATNYNTCIVVLTILGGVFSIYLACALIDTLRKYIFKWLKIDALGEWIANLFQKCFARILEKI